MKQQQHDIKCIENSEKSDSQMGFEPTTLRDLVGCSNHWATGDSMVSKMWHTGKVQYCSVDYLNSLRYGLIYQVDVPSTEL